MKTKLILTVIAASVLFPLSALSTDTLKQQYVDARYVTITHSTAFFHIDLNDVASVLKDNHSTFARSHGYPSDYVGQWWVILKNGTHILCNTAAPACNAEAKWNAYKAFLRDHPEFLNVP